jgi:hypothetical protein
MSRIPGNLLPKKEKAVNSFAAFTASLRFLEMRGLDLRQ